MEISIYSTLQCTIVHVLYLTVLLESIDLYFISIHYASVTCQYGVFDEGIAPAPKKALVASCAIGGAVTQDQLKYATLCKLSVARYLDNVSRSFHRFKFATSNLIVLSLSSLAYAPAFRNPTFSAAKISSRDAMETQGGLSSGSSQKGVRETRLMIREVLVTNCNSQTSRNECFSNVTT